MDICNHFKTDDSPTSSNEAAEIHFCGHLVLLKTVNSPTYMDDEKEIQCCQHIISGIAATSS